MTKTLAQRRAQTKYQREKLATVTGSFKKEFVAEFKMACEKLNISQNSVFREAMIKTINEVKRGAENGKIER